MTKKLTIGSIAQLTTEPMLPALGGEGAMWMAGEPAREIARLKAEVEALRKDAERYRWLRNHAPGESHFFHDGSESNYVELNVMFSGNELPDLDAAIDAAIATMPAVGAA